MWCSAPLPMVGFTLTCTAAAASPGLAPHQPLSSGQIYTFLSTCPQTASLVFSLLKKVERLQKISILQQESGGSPGQDSPVACGEERRCFKKKHLRVFLQKKENIFKALCTKFGFF